MARGRNSSLLSPNAAENLRNLITLPGTQFGRGRWRFAYSGRSLNMGYILLWLLGIPLPIILILALLWH